MTIDQEKKTGSVDITIETSSLNSNWAERDTELKGKNFFNVEQFPSMTFKSSSVKYIGTAITTVEGKLTLLGVSRPVTLTVSQFKCAPHPLLKKFWCGAEASATIKRSEFGMTAYLPVLPDEVNLVIPIEAGQM
ncbi:YceI family protein [Undibacterium sp. TC4M20W]|uniref:YceI family protein n=1 Tax=unclassified Undibacterium TaxID=2630295 RepID=UPI003BF380B4